ncbi:hypothetical protein [Streptomyces sp. NPDC091217]|uniref:hypothetical protein n=1 Tax=Streptomyces sp. NPDC091217 TaxID=3365975 RepID=UPI00381406DA
MLAGRPAVRDDLPRLQVTRRAATESLRVYSPAIRAAIVGPRKLPMRPHRR